MKYRVFGRTGLRVSEIGFGAWGISRQSWIGAEDNSSIAALFAARDAGVNFYDTALAYGAGHSERLLARAFGRSREILISTKVPPKNKKWPAAQGIGLREVFPSEYVIECLNTSLRNLSRDTVDLFQFHVWSDEWAYDPEWHATIEEIRRHGKARFIGISVNDHEHSNVIKALGTGLVDSVQTIYNIFDQSAEDELLPYCENNNIACIARVPFDEGGLTGKIHPGVSFPDGDFRNYYFAGHRKAEVGKRVTELVEDAGVRPEALPDLALRFCLSSSAISTVIPGMRSAEHVAANVKSSEKGPLSSDVIKKLHRHRWIRNFYSPSVSLPAKIKRTLVHLLPFL